MLLEFHKHLAAMIGIEVYIGALIHKCIVNIVYSIFISTSAEKCILVFLMSHEKRIKGADWFVFLEEWFPVKRLE